MKQAIAVLSISVLLVGGAAAYPIDSYEVTGINRLMAFARAQQALLARGTLVPGSLNRGVDVRLHLLDEPDFQLPDSDPELLSKIVSLLGDDASSYGIAVLDLTDLDKPRYAEHRGRQTQQPGSVGKILVALGWFQALADLYPDDIGARERILRDVVITANEFVHRDTHTVAMWERGDARIEYVGIEEGDQANVYTYLDWMCSASSNAAAAMLQYHLILLKHFGTEYPVSEERARAFFADSSKGQLQSLYANAVVQPVRRNGLDAERLRQGSFFTRTGKQRVPSVGSASTARELLRFLLLIEKGQLVDPWSSREMKRLLYLTERRIRYASSPTLNGSAVYYKSGSLYSCKPERGFICEKYHGNAKNYMNSIAIIETKRDGAKPLLYLVAVLSNVLKKNSANTHGIMAQQMHQTIASLHSVAPRLPAVGSPDAAQTGRTERSAP